MGRVMADDWGNTETPTYQHSQQLNVHYVVRIPRKAVGPVSSRAFRLLLNYIL